MVQLIRQTSKPNKGAYADSFASLSRINEELRPGTCEIAYII